MITINEVQNTITEEFALFDDWTDKYQYIIELGQKLEKFPEEHRLDKNKVKGCQSSVWLVSSFDDNKIHFQADSDSSIVKGLVALLLRVYSGRTPDEILSTEAFFIEQIGLKQHLAQTRANGLSAMLKQIKMEALAYSKINGGE